MAGLELFTNYAQTTTTGTSGTTAPASGTTETWTVTSSSSFPAVTTGALTYFHVSDPALPTEMILVTNISGTTWTVKRGAESTTPVAHATGATFKQVVTAGWLSGVAPSVYGLPVNGPSSLQPTVFQTANGMVVIPLSTYSLSGDDGAWINAAFNALPTWTDPDTSMTYTIGTVRLVTGVYNTTTQITKPPQCDLYGQGIGTVIRPSGSISAIYSHHPSTSGTVNNLTKSGGVYNLHIDGINAGANSAGLDMGDGVGHHAEDIFIQNFMQSGSVGLWVNSNQFWTEKGNWRRIFLWNNATACLVSTITSANWSMEYNDLELYIRFFGALQGVNTANIDQRGVVFSGVHWNGSLKVRGNAISPFTLTSNPVPAFLSLLSSAGNSPQMNGHIDFHVEWNGSGQDCYRIYFGDTTGQIGQNGAEGLFRFSGGVDPAAPAIGQFAMKGFIQSNIRQVQAPAFPATGVAYTNTQCDAMVTISGGTVTQVQIDGVTQAGTSGPFYLPNARTIKVTYTGSPSWIWTTAE